MNTFAFAEDLSFLGVFGAASNVVYSYAGARPSEIAPKKRMQLEVDEWTSTSIAAQERTHAWTIDIMLTVHS